MRPLLGHCHLGLGTLHRRTGKLEQAREHLNTAATLYREMAMCFRLEKAEAEVKAYTGVIAVSVIPLAGSAPPPPSDPFGA